MKRVVAHPSPFYFTDKLFDKTSARRAEIELDNGFKSFPYFCTLYMDFVIFTCVREPLFYVFSFTFTFTRAPGVGSHQPRVRGLTNYISYNVSYEFFEKD